MMKRGIQSCLKLSTQRYQFNRVISTTATRSYATVPSSFYELQAKDIEGNLVEFSGFKGKVCLVINVNEDELIRLSKGVVTHPNEFKQLNELRDLHEKYGHRDLAIIAFPTSEKEVTHQNVAPEYNVQSIIKQKQEAREEIKKVVHDSFKVMKPIHLNTMKENQVFIFLKEKAEELEKKILRHPEEVEGEDIAVMQMFTKFLVNRKGQVVNRFGKYLEPAQMHVLIEQLLAESKY